MKEILLTQDLITIVDDWNYDWLNQWKWKALKGKKTYYAARSVRSSSSTILMHREIMKAQSSELVDHKNGDGLINAEDNLRICTRSVNAQNILPRESYQGVRYIKRCRKWRAVIGFNYDTIHLGMFETAEAAALAYNKRAIILYGKDAKINIINL